MCYIVADLPASNEAIDFVFDEVSFHGSNTSHQLPGIAPGIWQDDSCVPASLCQKLMKHVETMRNVPDNQKDWHPGSNEQVLDLVHPSMFPLRYGVGGSPLTDHNGSLTYFDAPALEMFKNLSLDHQDRDDPLLTLSERAG